MRTFKTMQRLLLVCSTLVFWLGVAYASDPISIKLGPAVHNDGPEIRMGPQAHFNVRQGVNRQSVWRSEGRGGVGGLAGPCAGCPTPSPFGTAYPGFLSNPSSNATLTSAKQNPIYLNSPSTPVQAHWGFPDVFLKELNTSDLVTVSDQYTGNANPNGKGHYPLDVQLAATGAEPHIMHFSDLIPILSAAIPAVAAADSDDGITGHLYHIFLPSGQDFCFDAGNTVCYSPDIASSFRFCAFHTFALAGPNHVYLTLEPFQNIPGCAVTGPPSPQGILADSTASTLSHEEFETITDPDLNAWFNRDDLDLFGAEIGDECQSRSFNYPLTWLTTKSYQVQSEYTNNQNGCSYFP